MTDQHPEIAAHYEVFNEADRLMGDNQLEYLRTTEIIARHISPPPGVVADVGGGPGVYARWLIERGYSVRLFDIVPRHVDAAQGTNGHGRLAAELADARSVPMGDLSADAVLLLGPLYHLVERNDRLKALEEARRILRPGGTLFAAGISRFASAIDGVMQDFLADPVFRQIVERDLTDGQLRNPTNHPGYFTTAYFHRPQDLLDEVLEAGFGEAQILGVEGLGWALPQLDDVLEAEAARRRLFDILRRLETEPALLELVRIFWQ